MDTIQTLTLKLEKHLLLSKARVFVLSGLVLALLSCESVNLRKLSLRMRGSAKAESKYRQLQRFFPRGKV